MYQNVLDKLYVAKQIIWAVLERELLIAIPFLGQFSMNLRTPLYKFVSKILPQCNIKVVFQSKNQLSSFCKFKDSIPLYLRYHLLYKFQCSNCSIIVNGETESHLKVRASEHISASALTRKRVNDNKKFFIKDQCLLLGHHLELCVA